MRRLLEVRFLILAPAVVGTLLLISKPAMAEHGHRRYFPRTMVHYLMAHDAESEAAADTRLELQARSWDLVQKMRETLGSAYGGVWYNEATARYAVNVVGSVSPDVVAPYLESAGIASQTELVSVRSSLSTLEAEKERLSSELSADYSHNMFRTGIDPSTDSLILRIANSLSSDQVAAIAADTAGARARVEMIPEPPENLETIPAACVNKPFGSDPQVLFCSPSLRGGVTIFDKAKFPHVMCSLGFIVHNSSGEYITTAGHCLTEGNKAWYSAYTDFGQENPGTWGFLGEETGAYIGAEGDYGWIKVIPSASPWYPINDPSSVASLDPYGPWGDNEQWFLENIAWSAQKDIACRTGGSSDTQCGEVEALGEEGDIEGHVVQHLARANFCAIPGDSGGTVWGAHSGLGMTEAVAAGHECGEAPPYITWYTEAIRDIDNMGLSFYVPPYGSP